MNVGIIGSGGREHAITHSIKSSKNVENIYCIPGNAGTNKIAKNIEININNFDQIKSLIIEKSIDFLIIGPEKPLVDGLVDYLKDTKVKITKLAQGLPIGGEIENLDDGTLISAFKNRSKLNSD